METLTSPVRYENLTELDVQAHLRHCASKFRNGDRLELLLNEAGVIVPVDKRVYIKKPSVLLFVARSGSLGRDCLTSLEARLEAEDCDFTSYLTSKRKLLRRITVPLSVEDPLLPVQGTNILNMIASELDCVWPCTFSAGYGVGGNGIDLPGDLVRGPLGDIAYDVGRMVGKLVGSLMPRDPR